MGRLEKMKRLIIEQANKRILNEQTPPNGDLIDGEPDWEPNLKNFTQLDRFEPLIGKTAIFKPITGTGVITNDGFTKKSGDQWELDYSIKNEMSDYDKFLAKSVLEKVNGKITKVNSVFSNLIRIYVDSIGNSPAEKIQSNLGIRGALKEITYECGTKQFELHYHFDDENIGPSGSEAPFLFGKHIFIDATCDGLADVLETMLPCDKGHDFSKNLENGDLENLSGTFT